MSEGTASHPMGLQRERTLLSWNRTLLTLMVVTALVLRAIGPPYPRLLHVPGIVIGGLAIWLSLAADLRYRRPLTTQRVGGMRHLLVLWLCTVAMGLGGGVAIVFGR